MFEDYKDWSKKNIRGIIIEFKEVIININEKDGADLENPTIQEKFVGVYVINKVIIYGLHYIYKNEKGEFKKIKVGEKLTLLSVQTLLNSMNESPISHGDIIVCPRPIMSKIGICIYSHWAIYDQKNGVILEYYSPDDNDQNAKNKPILKETPISVFLSRERYIHTYTGLNKKDYKSPDEVIERARNLVNDPTIEKKYSLFKSNCQHYASHCKIGKGQSYEVFYNVLISGLFLIILVLSCAIGALALTLVYTVFNVIISLAITGGFSVLSGIGLTIICQDLYQSVQNFIKKIN